jgi:hypothetical protein
LLTDIFHGEIVNSSDGGKPIEKEVMQKGKQQPFFKDKGKVNSITVHRIFPALQEISIN